MPVIPRYQSRGGPSVGGLNYASAYQPPNGDDWRLVAQTAKAASSILGELGAFKTPEKAEEPPPPPPQGGAAGRFLGAKAREVIWRRSQLERSQAGLEAVTRSRDLAGQGLEAVERAAFDQLTGPREAGFAAAGAAQQALELQTAERQLSEQRQALGVDEYVWLGDVAPEQARAALGSAIRELTDRLTASGAGAETIDTGRRGLLNDAVGRRVRQAMAEDPARAATVLDQEGAVLDPSARDRLRLEVETEQTRREAARSVQRLAAEHHAVEDDLEGLMARAQALAGASPDRQAAYRGAAVGAWREARQRREAQEGAAWQAVEPYLDPSQAADWTTLPGAVWTVLSPRQKTALQGRFEAPWKDSDPEVVQSVEGAARTSPEAFAEMDLTGLLHGLHPRDFKRLAGLQQLARAGGADWEQARGALPPAASGNPLLIRASLNPFDPQSDLSERDKAINKALEVVAAPDGMFVNDKGQVVRRGPRRWDEPLGMPPKMWSEVVVSDEDALRYRAARFGVDPADKEALYRREDQLLEARFPDLAPSGQSLSPARRKQLRRQRETGEAFDRTPEMRALARVVALAEGRVNYNSLGGDLRNKIYTRPIPETHPGRVSGRYQINGVTWEQFGVKVLGATDYSQRTQDMTFVAILDSDKITEPLLKGDFDKVVELASKRWASFPDPATGISRYTIGKGKDEHPQPSESMDSLRRLYKEFLAEEKARPVPAQPLPLFWP